MLVCMVAFLTGTVSVYQRVFSSEMSVELHAASSANALRPESDVKVRGMVIGRVADIQATPNGAKLRLELEPDKAEKIPSNVTARLLPRTLFGERYVTLDVPEDPSSAALAAGDVITQDRSSASVEMEKVLSDMMPVLKAVHPEELAVTLNSLSHALDGRGKQLGETITELNSYLEGLNPSIPDLQENLKELVGFTETYEHAAPDLAKTLGNLSTTARTLSQQRGNIDALTKQLTATAGDTTDFLKTNKRNLIRLGDTMRPTLDVLSRYSPEFPCFLNEMAGLIPRADKVFGKGTDEPGLHIKLEIVSNRGKYEPNQDEPEFNDKRGPRCFDHEKLPIPAPQYPPEAGPLKDGSVPPPAARTEEEGLLPAGTSSQSGGLGVVNSGAERNYVSALMAPTMGVPAEDVPEWGSLLVGPVLRGAEVSYE